MGDSCLEGRTKSLDELRKSSSFGKTKTQKPLLCQLRSNPSCVRSAVCGPAQTSCLSAEGRDKLCLCGIFSRCGRKTFLSLEKQTLVDPAVLERVRGPPGRQPTYGSYVGWQSAVRSHSQARRRGLTLSMSWSLWVYHSHLHDTESEQPTVWVSVPAGSVHPSSASGPRSRPPCGVTQASCIVTLYRVGRPGLALNPDGHLWALAGVLQPVRQHSSHPQRRGRGPG